MGNKLKASRITSIILATVFNIHCGTALKNHSSIHDTDSSNAFESRQPNGMMPLEPRGLKLMWPLAVHRITQTFKPDSTSRKRPHDGIDISAHSGTRIYAPADGTVIYAGHKFHGYGKMIMIEHTPSLTTLFAHCQKLLVKSGEAVHKGNLIALVGRTGRATAPHLHFEVRLNREPVDPLAYLP